MTKKLFLILLVTSALIFTQCSDSIVEPPEISIEELLSAPDTINVEGQKIILTTALNRDFMPSTSSNGKPLAAAVYIETADSSVISSSINADAVYIINNNQVWKSFLKDGHDYLYGFNKFRIAKWTNNGPKWGPGITVDVVVRVIAERNRKFLLKASGQFIGRTD